MGKELHYDPAAGTALITLPLPFKELSPNGRPHHMAKARRVKQYRGWAAVATRAAVMGPAPHWARARVQLRFFFTQNRGRDGDNLLASMKSAMDGIADAGLVGNDRGFTYLPVEIGKDPANPRVEIHITREAAHGAPAVASPTKVGAAKGLVGE